jgi:hypothetical protein
VPNKGHLATVLPRSTYSIERYWIKPIFPDVHVSNNKNFWCLYSRTAAMTDYWQQSVWDRTSAEDTLHLTQEIMDELRNQLYPFIHLPLPSSKPFIAPNWRANEWQEEVEKDVHSAKRQCLEERVIME